jgi:regulator of cell morphogenesis and NO signaling
MIKDMGNMKNGKYREADKMSDLICENYPMVLVMSRFGIDLGFGEKNIGEVCRQNEIDTLTFLTVVNFLTDAEAVPVAGSNKDISISSLITYLHNAHDYFLNFRLPHIRHKLTEAIVSCPKDVAYVIRRFFDEYPGCDRICRGSAQAYVVRGKDRFPLRPQPAERGKGPEI